MYFLCQAVEEQSNAISCMAVAMVRVVLFVLRVHSFVGRRAVMAMATEGRVEWCDAGERHGTVE